jgi:hypothetical protein
MSAQNLDRIQFVTRHFNELRGLRYGVPLGLLTLSVGGTTFFSNRSLLVVRAALALLAIVLFAGSKWYYRRTFGEVESQPVEPEERLGSLSVYSPGGTASWPPLAQGLSPLARRLLVATTLAFVLLISLRAISPAVSIAEDESLVQAPWLALAVPIFMIDGPAMPDSAYEVARTLKPQALYALYGSLFLVAWLWRGRRFSQSYYLAFGIPMLWLAALGATLGSLISGAWSPRVTSVAEGFLPAVTHFWIALIVGGTAMIVTGLLDHWQIVRVLKPAVEERS